MDSTASTPSVLVIGSGISGLACARALHDGGATVRVVDRGRVNGGRLATKRLDDRPVDIGARYFTVPDDPGFTAVVGDWLARGLVRPWTDTFQSYTARADGTANAPGTANTPGTPDTPGTANTPGTPHKAGTAGTPDTAPTPAATAEPKHGPMRYAAPAGLRSLATDLAERLHADGVQVEQETLIAEVPESGVVGGIHYDTVVLAMPDPQAARMLEPGSPVVADLLGADQWQPTISVVLAWKERLWPEDVHGAFVNDSPIVAFVADDGDRRGDGVPVLVVHTTPEFARQHLEHPEDAVAAVIDAVSSLFGIAEPPTLTYAHRWTFSNPAEQHLGPFLLRGRIAVCGDAWGARSSVSTAWASGDALGRALALPGV